MKQKNATNIKGSAMMDQTFINWIFAALGASLGWLMKVIWDAIKELKGDIKQIERDLPEIYVRRDDFRIAVLDIKDDMKNLREDLRTGFQTMNLTLSKISDRLDNKEDRD